MVDIHVLRPQIFFRPNGNVPKTLELQIQHPAIFLHLDDAQFAELVRDAVEARERIIAEGRSFAGEAAVMAQKHTDSPYMIEPRRQLNPRIGAKDKWRRIEALRRLTRFLEDYREAYKRFRDNIRDVIFPAGTYAMHLRYGVLVADDT